MEKMTLSFDVLTKESNTTHDILEFLTNTEMFTLHGEVMNDKPSNKCWFVGIKDNKVSCRNLPNDNIDDDAEYFLDCRRTITDDIINVDLVKLKESGTRFLVV
jgi:hypothetical protein